LINGSALSKMPALLSLDNVILQDTAGKSKNNNTWS
jgi:hypothetical protein